MHKRPLSQSLFPILLLALSTPSAWAQAYQTTWSLAKMYYDQGHYNRAHMYYSQTLAEAEASGHTTDLVAASILQELGQTYYQQQDYSSAQSYWEREKQILADTSQSQDESDLVPRAGNDAGQLANCLTCLGDARFQLSDFSDAQRNYKAALKILKTLPEDYEIAHQINQVQSQLALCKQNLAN